MVIVNVVRSLSPTASARLARRLHGAFQRMGVGSHLLALDPPPDASAGVTPIEAGTEPTSPAATWGELERLARASRGPDALDLRFSLPGLGLDLASHPLVQGADIVLLHDVAGFVSPESVQGLYALGSTVVWSLPDCRPFTGGCHAVGSCTSFISDCALCPVMVGEAASLPAQVLHHSLEHGPLERVTVVAPGDWFARRARLSRVLGASRMFVIPPGVDPVRFSPELRDAARRQLGLAPDRPAIAVDLSAQGRPGRALAALRGAATRLPSSVVGSAAVILIGDRDPSSEALGGLAVLRPPRPPDDEARATLVAAADLLLLADGELDRPDALLEAVACGVSTIAPHDSCAAELIADGKEGWLFAGPSEEALSAALEHALGDAGERVRRGRAALARHARALQAEREAGQFLALFEELLREVPSRRRAAARVNGGPLSALPSPFPARWRTAPSRESGPAPTAGSPPPAAQPRATRARWPRGAPPGPPLPERAPGGKPWPRISIVSPSFNQGAFIEETILSVVNQGYPDVEHLVIDGGLSDGTAAVLARHSHHLTACVSEPDAGQSHAINKGMALASGEILTWLNSDDALAPGALAAVALAFQDPSVDLVAGVCELFKDGELIHRHLTACRDGPLPLDELLDLEGHWHPGQFFYQPEVFYRRQLWERAGGFVDGSLRYSMDYDLWVRFAQCGARLHAIGRPLVRFRVHDAQKTAAPERFRPELEQVRTRYRARIEGPPAGDGPPGPGSLPATQRLPRLRVAMVNDVGFRYGAGIGHARLARAIALGGHEVLPLAAWDETLQPGQAREPIGQRLEERLSALAPDLVLVGNVHGARLGPEFLGRLARRWPTIFVHHDCWLLTGRCAYPGTCAQYLSSGGCDHTCPTPTEYPALDPSLIAEAWRAKRDLRSLPSGLTLAANGRWMAEEIRRVDAASGLVPRDVPVLRLGLPLDVFRPRDQTLCRELVGLPQDRFIILFSATGLADPRKGLAHLLAAFDQAALPDALLVGMGWVPPEERARLPGIQFTGYVEDARTRALLFSAADVMVAPSLHEAFGQVLIEAAACGTPSVAYAVGGIPEALADGITGLLVPEVDPAGLARAIRRLHEDPVLRRDLGTLGRIHVENEFSTEQAYRHVFHAFQATLAARGVAALPPKLSLLNEAPFPRVEYVIPPAHHAQQGDAAHSAAPIVPLAEPEGIERHVHQYFVDRLARLRARRLPWYLSPAAWLARINRQILRREMARARDWSARPTG